MKLKDVKRAKAELNDGDICLVRLRGYYNVVGYLIAIYDNGSFYDSYILDKEFNQDYRMCNIDDYVVSFEVLDSNYSDVEEFAKGDTFNDDMFLSGE